MNVELVKEIVSISSSLAVIVTLIYLLIQLRQTKNIASIEAFREASNVYPFYDLLLKDRDHFVCICKAMDNFNLCTPYERHIFNATFAPLLYQLYGSIAMVNAGFVSRDSIEPSIDAISGILATTGGRQYWEKQQELFTEEYREIIADKLNGDVVPLYELQTWYKVPSRQDTEIMEGANNN